MQSTINGLTMRYEIEGPEDAPWLTFSNSLAADLTMWDPQAAHLKDRFRILRYDTRGHGSTEAPAGPYSFEALAADVLALWDELGIQQSHFVGLSLGGMTAQCLALNNADRLLSLVISDSRGDVPDAYRDFWMSRILMIEADGVEPVVEPTLERWFTEDGRASQPDLMDDVRAMVRRTSTAGYIGCAQAILELNYLDHLDQITLPTLFIVGAQDGGTPPEASQGMHDRVAGSGYVEIDPGSHVCNLENPGEFNAALDGFLGDVG